MTKHIPTSYNHIRCLRIDSSKVNLIKYPERESKLFDILRNGLPTVERVEAHEQELSFHKLFCIMRKNRKNEKKQLLRMRKCGIL